MKKAPEETTRIKELKASLGEKIKSIRTDDSRGYITLRKFAGAIKIPASNLKYIEDGVNAPSPEVYEAIVCNLPLVGEERNELDALYSAIRGTPPPDICRIVCQNEGMNEILRIVDNQPLTYEQMNALRDLFGSFKNPVKKGDSANG